jgi:hypothetical protein
MGVNYYSSNDKTMAKQQIDLFHPATSPAACKFYCKGQIIAFDLVWL